MYFFFVVNFPSGKYRRAFPSKNSVLTVHRGVWPKGKRAWSKKFSRVFGDVRAPSGFLPWGPGRLSTALSLYSEALCSCKTKLLVKTGDSLGLKRAFLGDLKGRFLANKRAFPSEKRAWSQKFSKGLRPRTRSYIALRAI